jgi:hypothetical protein
LEVCAIPGRDNRRKEAWSVAKLGVRVKAYAKAIGIVLSTARVLAKKRIR